MSKTAAHNIYHCVNAPSDCSPLPSDYNKCKLPYGLISTNAVTKNNLAQKAVTLKELWKKRRGATRSEGKPYNPKTRKIANTEKFKTVLSNTI